MKNIYAVDLTPEEREEGWVCSRGRDVGEEDEPGADTAALADERRTGEETAEALLTSVSTLERTSKKPTYPVELNCSNPPEGRELCWGRRLAEIEELDRERAAWE